MFHQRDNLFISRRENGDVRILKLHSDVRVIVFPTVDTIFPAHQVQMDVTIPWSEWCSMIATVSLTGESHYNPDTGKHKWHAAVDFHNS